MANDKKSKNDVDSNDVDSNDADSKHLYQSKVNGGVVVELADVEEARRIKNCQIGMIVHAVRSNEGYLYPLPHGILKLDREFLRKIICGLFVKNVVDEDIHRTVCVVPIAAFRFRSEGGDGFVDWLEREL